MRPIFSKNFSLNSTASALYSSNHKLLRLISPQFQRCYNINSKAVNSVTESDLPSANENLPQKHDPHSQSASDELQSNSPKKSSFISGLSLFISGTKNPPVSEPSFEKIESSFGSLILSRLPAYSKYTIVNGNLVGKSKYVVFKKKTNGSALTALFNPLIGKKFVTSHLSTKEIAGDAVFAPLLPGDVTEIRMTGSVDYYVNKKNILAHSPLLKVRSFLDSSSPFSAGVFGIDKISGAGSFLLCGDSGLFKISLSKNEEYLLDSDYVVCWDSNIATQPDENAPRIRYPWKFSKNLNSKTNATGSESSSSPTGESLNQGEAKATTTATATTNQNSDKNVVSGQNKAVLWISSKSKLLASASVSLIKSLSLKSLHFVYDLLISLLYKTTRLLKRGINVPILVKVRGPGDIYLSTRSTNTTTNKLKRAISRTN